MSTGDKLKIIDVIELASNLVSKQPAGTTRREAPSANVLRIAPDKITEGAFVGNFLSTSNDADLINGADLRTQTTVQAEDLAINDCSKNEEVEDLTAGFPDRGVAVLLITFFIKTVDLSDLTRFVIAANESDAIRVASEPQLAMITLGIVDDCTKS